MSDPEPILPFGRPINSFIELTFGQDIVTDVSEGNRFKLTLTGDAKLDAPLNPIDGQTVLWRIVQDSVGNHNFTLDEIFNFGNKTTDFSTDANKIDYFSALFNSDTNKWDVITFHTGY